MNRSLFKPRRCRHCRGGFRPLYANQRTHAACYRLWRRRYQRLYQRKAREEIKRSMDGFGDE